MTAQSQQNINNDNDGLSLKQLILKLQEWWRYLLSKWMVIVIFGLIGGALGFMYSSLKKPIYTATSTFVLEEEKSGGGLGNLAGLASMAGVDLGGSGGGLFQGDNILQLYKSRTMIQQTLLSKVRYGDKEHLLIDRYIVAQKLREKWDAKLQLKGINFEHEPFSRVQDSLVGTIVKEINDNFLKVSKLDKKLSIIKVEFKFGDELFAKLFTDQVVLNVNQFYVDTKLKKSRSNVNILQRQTDSVRKVLNGAIFAVATTIDATPNLNPTRQVLRTPGQSAQFSAEANKAILGELVKNLELSKMALRKETPLIQSVDNPVLPLESDRWGKAKGILIGGLLGGFLILIFLVFKKFFTQVMA